MNRKLFKVEILTDKTTGKSRKIEWLEKYQKQFSISKHKAEYFIGEEMVSTDTYDAKDDNINILQKNGIIKDVAEASDMLNIQVLTKKVEKHYLCYYKF